MRVADEGCHSMVRLAAPEDNRSLVSAASGAIDAFGRADKPGKLTFIL